MGDHEVVIVEFIPNVGIDGIQFGATREDVRRVMRTRFSQDQATPRGEETDCYFDNSLQFSFEEDETLSFIEAAAPPPVHVRLLGMNTWEMPGVELLEKLQKIDKINAAISEEGNCPIFVKNRIALGDLDEQYDRVGRHKHPMWGAIGIGDERYYAAICAIHGVTP